MTDLQLFTASWRAVWTASKAGELDVAPVRISIGVPRFWLPEARSFPATEELMPRGLLGIQDRDEFEIAYIARLDEIGPDRIRDALKRVYVGKPLVLLCFESRPEDCHRGKAARWLTEHGFGPVPEWEPAR